MNWPFVFAAVSLAAIGLIILGKLFAVLGLALLIAEVIGVGVYLLSRNGHAIRHQGDDGEPKI